jgi:aromatic ring-opening dioxygenase catalytic subunit (LigB family)
VAELVGAFGVSHAPGIARDWSSFSPELRERLRRNFVAVGDRLRRLRVDVLVAIAPDHWTNFFLDNLPTVCIGLGARHDGPPEPFLAEFPRELAGDPAFARHLAETALRAGFEPSLSHRLALDHGVCLPLSKMELDPLPPIVPLLVNGLEPPMISIERCFAWGKLLAEAVVSYPQNVRVAVLASGGLSHSIGEATMGEIDEAFDGACLAAFADGDDARLAAFLEEGIPHAGNGAHEIRNWIIAHAASGSHGFETLDYLPVYEVYVGCGWASWNRDRRPLTT